MLTLVEDRFTVCPASVSEAHELAELAVIASDGLTKITWNALRGDNETALDVGARRAAGRNGSFSYHNAEVAFQKRKAMAAVVSYPLDAVEAGANPKDIPPMFVPLAALEQMAAGTWYINILATYPEARGQGAATQLLAAVEERAHEEGYDRLSLIVRDANPARRLYERFGFREVARAAMVKADHPLEGRDWVLMTKAVARRQFGTSNHPIIPHIRKD